MSKSQTNRIHCTKEGILLALKSAFQAGQSAPYDLKSQEVFKVYKELTGEEPSKKTTLPKRSLSLSELTECPNCSSVNIDHVVESFGFAGPVYSVICRSCGFDSGLGV